MNDYQKAYSILGLEPGANRESIQRRYKRLVMVWHPDRFPTAEGKKDAEEELKKINNAKDLLWKHFDSGAHKDTGCICQPNAATTEAPPPPRPKPNPHPQPSTQGPGPRQKTEAEQEAERRDAERRAKAAQDAAQEKQKQDEQARAFDSAHKQQAQFESQQLRWRIAMAEGVIFLVLCLFSWVGSGIGNAVRNNTNNNQPTPVVEKKDDPCSIAGTYSAAPAQIQRHVPDSANGKVTVWVVTCVGTAGGANVEGRDSTNHLILNQVYAPDWSIDHQDLLEADKSTGEIIVSRFKEPSDYVGKCVYRYDKGNHFLEVEKLDSQNNTQITATVERTKFGKFYSLTVRPVGGNTTNYYDTSGSDVKDQFYMSALCMNIEKYVEPPGTLESPEGTPLQSPDAGTETQRENIPRSPF